jgi:hypothetical protein
MSTKSLRSWAKIRDKHAREEASKAFDRQKRKRYRVDGLNLLDLKSGAVVGHLEQAGKVVFSKTKLFD